MGEPCGPCVCGSFTGTVDMVTDVSFVTPNLIQTKVTLTYSSGKLISVSSEFTETITTAEACD